MPRLFIILLLTTAFSAFPHARAEVAVPPIISDNMLLQRSKAAVWGTADPGEKVTVTIAETTASTVTGKNGKWHIPLPGLKPGIAGGMVILGKNRLTIHNVAVGDTWVCAGQSNMEFPLRNAINGEQEAAKADFPEIRAFVAYHISSETPLNELQGTWQVCTPETAAQWSAVGYFFARNLHQDLQIPIGIIQSTWAGTNAQAWTPESTLKGNPTLKTAYWDAWNLRVASYPMDKEEFDTKTLPEWQAAVEQATAAGISPPKKPLPPFKPNTRNTPSGLYNGMVHGLTKIPVKGVAWYQGSTNVGDAVHYQNLLPALIGGWRTAWNQPNLPFLIIQMANFGTRSADPSDSRLAELRNAQRLALKVPNTSLIVTHDIGEANSLNPKNKQEVARRLTLAANATAYGKKTLASGPVFADAKFSKNQVTLSFKPGTAAGLTTIDEEPPRGFALAGENQQFFWANAKMVTPIPTSPKTTQKADGKTKKSAPPAPMDPVIILSTPDVPKPVAVRYAWADNPDVNLVNGVGLPGSAFRTDTWPQYPPLSVPVRLAAPPEPPSVSGAEESNIPTTTTEQAPAEIPAPPPEKEETAAPGN